MRFQLWDEAVTLIDCPVHQDPAGETVGQIAPDTHLVIVGGPASRSRSNGPFIWWQINNGKSALSGRWIAEDAPNKAVLVDKWDDSLFGRSVRFVLAQEGGESQHELDPGRHTKYGILQRYNPNVNVEKLTLDKAKTIYRQRYWDPILCNHLPWPLCATVFDMAVNTSVGTAIMLLQAAGHDADAFNQARRVYYQSLETFALFGEGWIKRVDAIEKL